MLDKREYPSKVWRISALITGRRSPDDEVETNFAAYYLKNPDVWKGFCRYAHEARKAGKQKGSAWLIMNRMRWDDYLAAQDDNTDFKIANGYIGLYARLYMEVFNCPDFFNTKLRTMEAVRLQAAERTMQDAA